MYSSRRPPCEFRDEATGENHCRLIGRVVPDDQCRVCVLFDIRGKAKDPAAAPPPPAPAERFAVLPCTHRGAELRQEKCRMGCASETRTVAVHACAVRGECSVSRISRGQSLPLCTDCELRQP
mgnify:CR=1 FL=1